MIKFLKYLKRQHIYCSSTKFREKFLFSKTFFCLAPTQSPSYADNTPGNVNLPLSMDPVLAVVTNSTGQQVSQAILDETGFYLSCLSRQGDISEMISPRRSK